MCGGGVKYFLKEARSKNIKSRVKGKKADNTESCDPLEKF